MKYLNQFYNKFFNTIQKLAAFGCILFVALLMGCRHMDVPGLYFDAVYPDYIASVFAFPGMDNFYEITKCTFFPLLGNLYHGTISAIIQCAVLSLGKNASTSTIWITNVVVMVLILYVLFVFLYDITKKYWLSLLMVLLPITSDHIICYSRTQYYIFLNGALFLAISLTYMYRYICDQDDKSLVKAGIFQGLSFYGYFSYFVFIPVSLIYISIFSKTKKIEKIFIFCWSVLLGSLLYFWGFYDSIVINIMGKNSAQTCISIIGAAFIGGMLIWVPLVSAVDKLFKYKKMIIPFTIVTIIIGMAILSILLIKYGNNFISHFDTLSSNMKDRYVEEKLPFFFLFWKYIYNVMCNSVGQSLLTGNKLNNTGGYWAISILIINITTLISVVHKKNVDNINFRKYTIPIYGINGYLIGAYLISMPIITKLRTHHFEVFYFLFWVLLGIEVAYLLEKISNSTKRVFKYVLSVILIGGFFLNVYDNGLLYKSLETTGGMNWYSDAFVKYCTTEMESEKDAIYVFPEWGFYAPFVYLTSNSCKAVSEERIIIEDLQDYIDKGKTVKVVSWNLEPIDNVSIFMKNVEYLDDIWYTRDGKVSFYERTIVFKQ